MIDPDALLDHAEQIGNTLQGQPTDAALRRGISAAYYAVFHDLTGQAADHLVRSCPREIQNEIRRSWSHGEISQLAEYVVERAVTLSRAPDAPLPGRLEKLGPLLDVVAQDAALVESLELFNDMQENRYSADYDHAESFAIRHPGRSVHERPRRTNAASQRLARGPGGAVHAPDGEARRFPPALTAAGN